jgi:hypothetical protein
MKLKKYLFQNIIPILLKNYIHGMATWQNLCGTCNQLCVPGRGGLGPKSLCGNRFYKGHRDTAEKASHYYKKASIPLKMYLKILAILEKASIYLKKFSKYLKSL